MNPILFQFGGFQLATYGLFVAAGFIVGIYWLRGRIKEMGLGEDRFWGLIYSCFLGGMLGAKALFIALSWDSYAGARMQLFTDIRYGFVYFGGFVGAVLAGLIYARRFNLSFLKIADYFGVALPIGHAIGRIGCFMAGCCHGGPCTLPWAVVFDHPESLVSPDLFGVPVHPTQLYESLADLFIAAAGYMLLRRRTLRNGSVFLFYVVSYSIARFLVEFVRGDPRGEFVGGLSPSQWIAIACVAGALITLARRGFKPPPHRKKREEAAAVPHEEGTPSH